MKKNSKIVIISLFPILSFVALAAYNFPQKKTKPQQQYKSTGDYQWNLLTDGAAFAKSYNYQLFAIRDTLWAIHHDNAWFTMDGKTWNKSDLTNIINNNAFLDYVWFKNALYGIGSFKGNIETHTFHTSIFRTADMKNWEMMAPESNLPKRFFYHPFVFNDKIWIIGGSDETTMYADIWNSEDGIHWIKQADNLPFGKRDNSQFVLFNNKIFLINNDVWSSADGLQWTRETKEIVSNEEIVGSSAVVYDNHIWLLGCNRNGRFQSEILVSDDGKTWKPERAPWSPRGGIAACIYQDKIVMTGGKYGGPGIAGQTEFVYSNDVWALGKAK